MRGPEKIGAILDRFLKRRGMKRKILEEKVLLLWDDIVGWPLKAHSRPVKVEMGRIVVNVDDPAWLLQMFSLKKEIMEGIEKEVGPGVIKDIYFRIGRGD